MLSHGLFTLLVLLVALQRSVELLISRRNEQRLRRSGAREHAAGQLRLMQLLHSAWFVCMLLEVELLRPTPPLWLSIVAGFAFVVGQALRYAAMRALGPRWSVRVLTVPNLPPVTDGIFSYLRHPNYLGVMLEMAALPLVHLAWRTALFFTLTNAVLLAERIRVEERALNENGAYLKALASRPRLWPALRPRGVR